MPKQSRARTWARYLRRRSGPLSSHSSSAKVNFPWVGNAFDPWGPIVTPCSRAVLMMLARLSHMPRGQPFSVGLVGLALVFVVIGVLYDVGAIQVMTSTGQGHHTTHPVLFPGLAVGALILARFAWPERSR